MGNDDGWRPLDQVHVWQYMAAGFTFVAIVTLAVGSIWPFHETPPSLGRQPSIWEIVFNDRWLLGFLRAGLVAIAIYSIVSVPALIIAGRWMKGLGTAGVTADDAERADDMITAYEDVAADLESQNQDLRIQLGTAHRTVELLRSQLESFYGEGDGPD